MACLSVSLVAIRCFLYHFNIHVLFGVSGVVSEVVVLVGRNSVIVGRRGFLRIFHCEGRD